MTYIVIIAICAAAAWYSGHKMKEADAILDDITERIEHRDNPYEVYYRTKDGHFWVFRFVGMTRKDAIRQVARFAADPDIDFSWHDAAIVANQIRSAVISEIRVTV